MTDEELRQLIASNARAIEAAAGERAELRQAIVRIEQAIINIEQATIEIEQATLKLTEIQGGGVVLLGQLDEDRPTVFRKLNAIENKVDQLLQKPQNNSE